MRIGIRSAFSLSVALGLAMPGSLLGQEFPARTMRIVTADVASTNDLVARLVAQGLSANVGQQVIVENRGGASGALAAMTAAKAPPDGYTVLLYSSTLWIGPLLQEVPWDPVKDFAPVILAATSPNVLVVHPSLPVKSVKELVALARKRPGALNYGSSSVGSSNHLGAELFKSMAGVNIARINYKGGGAALSALMSGEVQVMFSTVGLVKPQIAAGRMRALAICSLEPSALEPGMPTVAAAGLPGYESGSIYGIFAPARTPTPLVARLNQLISPVLGRTESRENFFRLGVETLGGTPAQLSDLVRSDMAKMGKLIKDAGIRLE